MEVVRKPGNGTVPFSTVAIGDVFAVGDTLLQRIKVPGDDGEYATNLESGLAYSFAPAQEVQHVAGHFEET